MGQFNITNNSELFKINYGKRSENYYNSNNVVSARIKKNYKFTGKQKLLDSPTSFGGGVGSGRLPTASYDKNVNPILTAKKLYGVCEIDREAIKAADGDKGSFVSQTKHSVMKCVESWNRNLSRILFNDLDNGQLGVGDGSTTVTGAGSSGSPYLVIMSATGWKAANFEEQDYINCSTEATLLLVSAVNETTRQISLVGTSATLAAAVAGVTSTNAKFYMQNSKDNDPTGIAYALAATSGSLYSVTVQRRFQASVQATASSAGITTDMMNTDMLGIEKRCGKTPDLIVTSYTQYGKILNLLEDQKQYMIEPRSQDLKGKVSFKALSFQSATGEVPIVVDRFCRDDGIFYLNTDMIEIHHRPDFGWFEDDGTVFLRKADDDAYEARYGGYLECLVEPVFHGYRYSLAT